MTVLDETTTHAVTERFSVLEAERGGTYEGRVELAREALRWAHETFGEQRQDRADLHRQHRVVGVAGAERLGEVVAGVEEEDVCVGQRRAEQDAKHGPRLHDRDPNLCCAMRKVEPLDRALSDKDAWVTGMRREDAPTRTDIELVGWDAKRSMVKLNPIAGWTQDDVDRYVEEHGVFLNPLRQSGYASIGCAPCTRPVAEGEDPRAGRWSGSDKVECGLHT